MRKLAYRFDKVQNPEEVKMLSIEIKQYIQKMIKEETDKITNEYNRIVQNQAKEIKALKTEINIIKEGGNI